MDLLCRDMAAKGSPRLVAMTKFKVAWMQQLNPRQSCVQVQLLMNNSPFHEVISGTHTRDWSQPQFMGIRHIALVHAGDLPG